MTKLWRAQPAHPCAHVREQRPSRLRGFPRPWSWTVAKPRLMPTLCRCQIWSSFHALSLFAMHACVRANTILPKVIQGNWAPRQTGSLVISQMHISTKLFWKWRDRHASKLFWAVAVMETIVYLAKVMTVGNGTQGMEERTQPYAGSWVF